MNAHDMFFLLVLCFFASTNSHLKLKNNRLKNSLQTLTTPSHDKLEEKENNYILKDIYVNNLELNSEINDQDSSVENFETEHSLEAKGLNHLLSYMFK